MKYFHLLLALLLVLPKLWSQVDTLPPYQKDSTLPIFSIQQPDSSWFNNLNLPKNKQTVIIYFSPDCGHCQLTAHEFMKDTKRFKDIFFVWVSYQSMDEIKTFAETYKIPEEKNMVIGRDPRYYVPSFFRVKYTPYIAAYNKKGKLLQTFEGGTDPDTLYRSLHAADN